MSAESGAFAGKRERPASRRRLMWAIYVGFLVLLCFITYRAALWILYSANPIGLSTSVDAHTIMYPELFSRGIADAKFDEKTIGVLLLGGSVAEQTGEELEHQLSEKLGQSVKLYNAASAAHTTRDSFNKLRYLAENHVRFNLILVYHGINDVNLNRYPADLFRDDYTHSGWYYRFEALRANPNMSMKRMLRDTSQRLSSASHQQEFDWGNEIKTPPAFAANLRSMIEVAQSIDTPIVLMTFASYLPANYTKEAFLAGKLDYGEGEFGHPPEVWGWPDNVRKTIAAHNESVREVIGEHPEVPFVDVQNAITEPSDFCDVCHLTPQGIVKFADLVTDVIVESDLPLTGHNTGAVEDDSPRVPD